MAIGLAALAAVAAGTCAVMSSPAPAAAGLVVHEWGTFSSFSGSDGALLKFYPVNTDLPKFVHTSRHPFLKDELRGTVSLETPVLYFHTDRPLTATVRAEFPSGVLTEWFPRADRPNTGKSLTWANVRVRPGETATLPTTPEPNHYYAAREVDAAPVEVVTKQDGKEVVERERLLFYRGVGDLTPPVTVTARGGGAFSIRSTGTEPIPGGVLMEAKAGAVRFRPLGAIAPKAAVEAELPPAFGSAESLRAELVRQLTAAGLYADEARAMVKTWESVWFGDDGTRVLYVLPAGWTGKALPLSITPAPDAVVRVMVGRHDLLTPERERDIDTIVGRLNGHDAADREAAAAALSKLGRFGPPARQQAEQRLTKRR
jgi:hypothetical protein